MVRPKEFSAEQLTGLEWDMDKFLEQKEKTIAPTEALTYKDIHGRTSLRFINYDHVERQSDEDEESLNEPFIENVHIELIGEDYDKVIYPKELGMILDKEELLRLEEQMYLKKQIQENEYLYYDSEQNIRIGTICEDLEDNESIFSYEKDFMQDSSSYRTTDDTLFDKDIKHEKFLYGDGFPQEEPIIYIMNLQKTQNT
ncbi:hypothetical protein Adt_01087 [Abeliophyllum distichum]|uniref:Uncharacterized protein n=1 Tax=Abeliophyllum distichum TaxID=126358 RepID=A0ABD1VRX4_9LAMI